MVQPSQDASAAAGPLDGVSVVDLTQALAGPLCTMMLGDMGADVVKVEPPLGDMTRMWDGEGDRPDDPPAFVGVNRNKRSVVLDLKKPEHRERLLRLVAASDVLVENFRPGVTERLGIDHDSVREANPALVYASISGFGSVGPWADRAGVDLIAQAMSGLMSVTGEPGGDPVKCGVPLADITAGLHCTVGILGALLVARATGRGQRVRASLFASALSLGVWESAEYWSTGQIPQRLGSGSRLAAPYQALRAADGHLVLGAGGQRHWERTCSALGFQDLLADERFLTNDLRLHHCAALEQELESRLERHTVDYWVDRLTHAGVPAAPILNFAEVLTSEHTRAVQMIVTATHPVRGPSSMLGIPLQWSDTPGSIRSSAPLLGEHTSQVLDDPSQGQP